MEGKFEQTPTEAPAPVMRTVKDVKGKKLGLHDNNYSFK